MNSMHRNPFDKMWTGPFTSLGMCVLLIACSLAVGCTNVSGSGRTQFNAYGVHEEIQLGERTYVEMIAGQPLIEEGPDFEMITEVTRRIAQAAQRLHPEIAYDFDWEVVLIDDPDTANAWALPGGKMAVYSGILPVTVDADGLAVVMGHEAAHAIARHGGENMTRAGMVGILAAGVSVALDGEHDETIGAAAMAYGLLGEPAFSRQQESEADVLGLFITAEAGYDPRAAIGLWERMAERGGGTIEFLSTHPSELNRITELQEIMPQAMRIYRKRTAEMNNH